MCKVISSNHVKYCKFSIFSSMCKMQLSFSAVFVNKTCTFAKKVRTHVMPTEEYSMSTQYVVFMQKYLVVCRYYCNFAPVI